jgi:hypothetical protein
MEPEFTAGIKPQRRDERRGAKPQPNCAKRLECVELAPALRPPPRYDSASKLDALQTLRVAVHPQTPSQLANNFDYCSAENSRALNSLRSSRLCGLSGVAFLVAEPLRRGRL